MTLIVTSDYQISRIVAPALPNPTPVYDEQYLNNLNNILRMYFNQIDKILGQLMANTSTLPVSIDGTNTDAFGRIRVSQPYTLFDSQNRFAADNQFDTATTGTGSAT